MNGTMKARVQTMRTMIRQCTAQQFTYLHIRTCGMPTIHDSPRGMQIEHCYYQRHLLSHG